LVIKLDKIGGQWDPANDGILSAFITKRFDLNTKYLDLGSLTTQQELQGLFISFSNKGFVDTLFNKILTGCGEKGIISLNLADNSIRSLKFVGRHIQTIGGILANLSLEGNLIADLPELDYLDGVALEQLILSKNPVATTPDYTAYSSEVMKRIPTLKLLDGQVPTAPSIFIPTFKAIFF